MTKVSVPGFIHAKPTENWECGANVVNGLKFDFYTFEDLTHSGWVMVTPFDMAFEIPAGWDPRPLQIKALQDKRNELTREFSEAVLRIDQQISQLQAIEFTAEPA